MKVKEKEKSQAFIFWYWGKVLPFAVQPNFYFFRYSENNLDRKKREIVRERDRERYFVKEKEKEIE